MSKDRSAANLRALLDTYLACPTNFVRQKLVKALEDYQDDCLQDAVSYLTREERKKK